MCLKAIPLTNHVRFRMIIGGKNGRFDQCHCTDLSG